MAKQISTILMKDLPIKQSITDDDYVVVSGGGTKKLKIKDITKDVEKKAADLEEKTAELGSQLDNKASNKDLEVERARINNLSKLEEGSTTGDAELLDGRIGIDGITYDNIGESIRNQVKSLELEKSNNGFNSNGILKDTRIITWNSPNVMTGVYSKVGSDTSPILEVEGGKKYCFISNGELYTLPNVITQMTFDMDGVEIGTITPSNKIYTIPDGVKYLRFTINGTFQDDLCFKEYSSNMSLQYEEYGTNKSKKITEIDLSIKSLKEDNINIGNKFSTIDKNRINIKSILNKDNLNRQLISNGEYLCDFSDATPLSYEEYISLDSNLTKYSDKSVKIDIPIGTVNAEVKLNKQLITSFKQGDIMCIMFYVDWDSVEGITTTGNNAFHTIRVGCTTDSNIEIEKRIQFYELIRGWQMVKIPFDEDTNIISIYVNAQSNINSTGNIRNAIIHFDSVFKNYKMKPAILLNFDNMIQKNMYGVVYPLLESFGFKGTFYLGEKLALGGGYITKEQFDEMIDNGWDYSFYGASGSTFGFDSDYNDAYNYVKDIIEFRKQEGIPLPIAWFCQNGQTSNTFSRVLRDLGFKIVRGTGQPCINYFGEDSLETRFNSFHTTQTDSRLEQMKDLVVEAIDQGSIISVFTHQLLETPDITGINSTVEDWTKFLTFLKEKVDNGLIEVLTYKEFYERCVRTSLVEKQFNLRNMYRIKSLENK